MSQTGKYSRNPTNKPKLTTSIVICLSDMTVVFIKNKLLLAFKVHHNEANDDGTQQNSESPT